MPPVTIEALNEKENFDDRQCLNEELEEMFFRLDLIQSYGSGIRRAKIAMVNNGFPKLVFSPGNDADDHTQVVAYVNEEFARIQEEELARDSNRQEITQEELSIEDRIIRILVEKPDVIRKDLAQLLGITPDNVKYRLDKLRESGRIEHRGPIKAGKWVGWNNGSLRSEGISKLSGTWKNLRVTN